LAASSDIPSIRARIAYLDLTREQVAMAMGLERSALSRYLNGTRPMPEGMEARIHATLDKLERAEQAAQEARERVLGEGE